MADSYKSHGLWLERVENSRYGYLYTKMGGQSFLFKALWVISGDGLKVQLNRSLRHLGFMACPLECKIPGVKFGQWEVVGCEKVLEKGPSDRVKEHGARIGRIQNGLQMVKCKSDEILEESGEGMFVCQN